MKTVLNACQRLGQRAQVECFSAGLNSLILGENYCTYASKLCHDGSPGSQVDCYNSIITEKKNVKLENLSESCNQTGNWIKHAHCLDNLFKTQCKVD